MAVELSQNALTTLDVMKTMLAIDPIDSTKDDLITNLVNGVSAWIERMTGRNLRRQLYVQKYDASGSQNLVLLQWPIVSVDYVKSDGEEIDPSSYDYGQTGHIGVVYRDQGWPLRVYIGGLSYDMVAHKRVLEVKYTAGYVLPQDASDTDPCTLPYDLQKIVWDAVMQEFSIMQSGAMGLAAFSISDVSWTFDKSPRPEWLATIAMHTRL